MSISAGDWRLEVEEAEQETGEYQANMELSVRFMD